MGRQVRSGRSTQGAAHDDDGERADAAAAGLDGAAAEVLPDVLVVGGGPVALGVAAGWGSPVRTIDEVPEVDPAAALAGAEVVVLVCVGDPPGAVGDVAAAVAHAQRLFAGARSAGVAHVVVVTSAVVHGAWPARPVIHDDDPIPRPDKRDTEGLVARLRAIESVVARASGRRRPAVAVLRPAAVVGTGVDTFVTRHFEAPRLLTVRGSEREWQFVHVADVASAARFAVEHRLTGALTVGAADTLTPEQVQAASGMRRVELAPATAFGTAERLHRVGVLPAPASELAFVVHPWTVASDRLRAAGWQESWSSAACLDVLLEGVQGRLAVAGRRVGARDAAALGAAGAAVAAIGTAAIWRQARQRRRR
ncbi:nucleoside-diphosphate sugar epimerase [Cellulomonas sp. HZM]|uniref:nucleoside-diphosphate sugar epimerase n=1 Tax=Cellulomonas sp. HZM TaxID=1454010 RepID=UPI000B2F1BD7|nr:nucleoside-diphosphate sugar epimerase [Cellulomonas sp. HZM]